VRRTWPVFVAGEREMLEAWLEWHRDTLARKCDGLSAEQLRERAVPPSTISLLGLVRHMAEVERAWFQRRIARLDVPRLYSSGDDPDGDFDHVDGADVDEAFESWRAECERACEILRDVDSLDTTFERDGERISVRWVVVHMIEEYARHAGHADLIRERIDGSKGV
jgi:uncharacterized damage-inducible protein DinB